MHILVYIQTHINDRLYKCKTIYIGFVAKSFILIWACDKMLSEYCCRHFISQEMKSKEPELPLEYVDNPLSCGNLLDCLSCCS